MTGDRPLANYNYNSLSHQASRVYSDVEDHRKANTLPRQYNRNIIDGPKLAKTETETGSAKYFSDTGEKHLKGKLTEGNLRLLDTKMRKEFESETSRDAVKKSEVSEPGWVGPVFRRGLRSRPGLVASRRCSVAMMGRRVAKGRKVSCSGRVPPVGASTAPPRVGGPPVADWVSCLDGKDSDEESYVTACNSTPLLSRIRSPARKERSPTLPNNRKSVQTGSGRRKRRRLKSLDPVKQEAPAPDPSEPQISTDTNPVFVPIPIIVLLLCLYVFGAAAMFHKLYGAQDWSLAMFVSLTATLTVGGWYPAPRGTCGTAVGHSAVGPGISWPPDERLVYATWLVISLTFLSACLRLAIQTISNCSICCRKPQTDWGKTVTSNV